VRIISWRTLILGSDAFYYLLAADEVGKYGKKVFMRTGIKTWAVQFDV